MLSRRPLRALVLGLALGGGPGGCRRPSDATLYVAALSEDDRYERARAHCARIIDVDARGDCLVAIMERFDRLDAGECLALAEAEPELALWRDECVFQLAERLRARQRIEDALRLCLETRFSRECSWHLVRDEAEASIDEAPAIAELRLARFTGARRLPDAGLQFWMIRFRAQAARGVLPDERVCGQIVEPEACIEAFRRHIRQSLATLQRVHEDRACADDADVPDTLSPEPGWADGPIARATVAGWRARHCGRPAGGGAGSP
ncbi:MAG: hypothetical protein D6798_14595 [Deltaproteobacteria bacterium]|nr:MAG: hypothetical protein D6798_14595 [Deltaproteobacteria bacterium]